MNTEAYIVHSLLNNAHWVRQLCLRIYNIVGDSGGDIFTNIGELMLAFLLADLELAVLENLEVYRSLEFHLISYATCA
jgi:hypothetical protein